ncbi:hypothetical protein SAMN05660429_02731 [Thalassotalea agarivorans]|uniref:Uncharacterized protein n=2 Tax=Thalassotalea agarivorans TaxID=349064 RepID=A0A1I0HA63_THASX|nr:hypothetical protein SAMN05660429_02731 [Thalassotalea agarivorans]
MYTNFVLANTQGYDNSQLNFQKCIIGGNWTMIVSFSIALICLMVTFQFEQHFTLHTQIFAHIATILFAGLFKIGYVLRCVGVHGLGYKVF